MARRQLTLDNTVAAELAGSEDAVLRALRGRLDCDFHLRGNVLTLDGDSERRADAATVVDELVDLIEQGHEVAPGTIEAVDRRARRHESPAEILEDVVWRHRNTKVAPKTLNQKRYVDSIRRHTITFGDRPGRHRQDLPRGGDGGAALAEREVQRIILTRPAVEAGERLGFLPGDIQAKVDPYLRPLFDALYDMLDPDRVNGYFERGVIEVAPLAFMRGRAQPVDRQVLTPRGSARSGSSGRRPGGRLGRPADAGAGRVPAGPQAGVPSAAQDGASTLCCAEHLWFVTTPDDRKHGKPGRVSRPAR